MAPPTKPSMAKKTKTLREVLPVTFLLFTFKGRIDRRTYWLASVFLWSDFYIFYKLFSLMGNWATWPFIPLMLWATAAVSTKRFHDRGKSGLQFLWIFVPVFGLLYVSYQLGLRGGQKKSNVFGVVPGSELDYYKNDDGEKIPHIKTEQRIINDVTGLNPVIVREVFRPESIAELQEKIRATTGKISVGGGRFSMGGQTADPESLHIDLRRLNRIVELDEERRIITVEAGIRWCDIQAVIDRKNLSIKIMQTYANFTVGGALSVNAHGRYTGLGPVILSVKAIKLILAFARLSGGITVSALSPRRRSSLRKTSTSGVRSKSYRVRSTPSISNIPFATIRRSFSTTVIFILPATKIFGR
jgi:uncharacterized membrane protein YhaH (DUF805 family)